jgi:hypothetical protein
MIDPVLLKHMVNTFIQRVHDKTPAVRGRAINVLTDIVVAWTDTRNDICFNYLSKLFENDFGMIIDRMQDDKFAVRKAAIQLATALAHLLLKYDESRRVDSVILAIGERMRDMSATIRKLVLVSLTKLVSSFPAMASILK